MNLQDYFLQEQLTNDELFGDSQIYQQKNQSNQLVQIEYSFLQETDFDKSSLILENLKNQPFNSIYPILDCQKNEQRLRLILSMNHCSQNDQLNLSTLEEESVNLFFQILKKLIKLEELKYCHENITPLHIRKENDNYLLYPRKKFLVQNLYQNLFEQLARNQQFFCSPEIFSNFLQQKQLIPDITDDLFSLSMTVLTSIEESIAEKSYSISKKKFEWQMFDESFENLKKKINFKNLHSLLKLLKKHVLQEIKQNRVSPMQLKKILMEKQIFRKYFSHVPARQFLQKAFKRQASFITYDQKDQILEKNFLDIKFFEPFPIKPNKSFQTFLETEFDFDPSKFIVEKTNEKTSLILKILQQKKLARNRSISQQRIYQQHKKTQSYFEFDFKLFQNKSKSVKRRSKSPAFILPNQYKQIVKRDSSKKSFKDLYQSFKRMSTNRNATRDTSNDTNKTIKGPRSNYFKTKYKKIQENSLSSTKERSYFQIPQNPTSQNDQFRQKYLQIRKYKQFNQSMMFFMMSVNIIIDNTS